MKKLVLHVGIHKTATTSLQDFLRDHMGKMLRHGVKYIALSRMRSDVTPLIISGEGDKRKALADLLMRFDKPTLLLSDENILGAPGDIPSGELYAYAGNRLRRLCDQFPDTRIEVHVTLRRPGLFLTSMYCEYLRHNPFLSFSKYTDNFDISGFSYARIFDWSHDLPDNARVVFTPFEADRDGGIERITGDLVSAACEADHNIDLSTFPQSRSRSSYSVEELETAAEISARGDPRTAQFFLNMLDSRDCRFGSTRFDPLESDLVAELDTSYDRDLETLRRT